MLIDRVRSLLFLPFLLFLLAACSGGGGNPGPGPGQGTTTGSLQVTIAALPAGLKGAVRVTGPNNYAQDLTASQTLANLVPGSYNVAAASVTLGSATYTPSPATQSAVVTAGATTTATVTYAGTPFALALSDIGPSFTNPTFVTAPPGDDRLFVVERAGIIRIVRNGAVAAQPWLDISAKVFTGGEGGLLSLAFDPDFGSNGYVYVYYTNLDQDIVVERYASSTGTNLADPTSALTILRVAHPQYQNHFGGLVAFGPDGLLYAGTGDGGGAGDPLGNGQNPATLLGKILRVDVRGATAGQPYTIPPSNPFVNQPGLRPEIWVLGLRNPWRFAFDGEQVYIADVGQDEREEVNIAGLAQGGLNFGWNRMEGSICYGGVSCDRVGLTLPSFEYEHGANDVNGCSITGGFVYRGTAIPELAGRYFYSDYCRGFVKSFFATGGGIAEQRDWNITSAGRVVSFGRDGAGELYVVGANGKIWRIVRAAAP